MKNINVFTEKDVLSIIDEGVLSNEQIEKIDIIKAGMLVDPVFEILLDLFIISYAKVGVTKDRGMMLFFIDTLEKVSNMASSYMVKKEDGK